MLYFCRFGEVASLKTENTYNPNQKLPVAFGFLALQSPQIRIYQDFSLGFSVSAVPLSETSLLSLPSEL